MTETKEYTGRTVLVTGSTKNTGLAIAKAFLAQGATVYLNGLTDENVTYALAQINAEVRNDNGEARSAAFDVGKLEDVQTAFRMIKDEAGGLDVLVNNAVVQGIGGPLHEVDTEEFEKVIRTNLCGYFYCSREAAKLMVTRRRGSIVNLGSNTSECAIRNRSAYVMSKGGIDAFTRAMAVDLGGYGIRVNTVAPGYIHTDRWDTLDPEIVALRRSNIPLGYESTPRDIAEAVLFMASDRARSVHGASLVVDGGCNAQNVPLGLDM